MSILSHFQSRLSIGLLIGALAIAGAGAGQTLAAAASAKPSPYFGRWTVDEDRPVFTVRGRAYKTIDVAMCGKDFCGVSVDAKGQCGATLFRFLGKRLYADRLQGHGKWGDAKKNVVIYNNDNPETPIADGFGLYLGDGYNFGDRSDNMPKFHALYRRLGGAKCRVS
jgi:hypothetical protein